MAKQKQMQQDIDLDIDIDIEMDADFEGDFAVGEETERRGDSEFDLDERLNLKISLRFRR